MIAMDTNQCPICDKTYSQHSSLKRHFSTNHLNCRVACLKCGKTYRRQEDKSKHNCTAHLVSVATQTDISAFPTAIDNTWPVESPSGTDIPSASEQSPLTLPELWKELGW